MAMLAMAIALLGGCADNHEESHYRLECKIAPELGTDSVALMLVKDDYNSVYHVATVARSTGGQAFVFEGDIDQSCVAYLKFSNDTTPMLFVLEPGLTQITIDSNGLVLSGGSANHEYMTFLKARKALLDQKKMLHHEYLSHVASDSTISMEIERRYLTRDSLLTDSIEHITVNAINIGSLASRIILDQYVNTLSPQNLQNIHKK